MSPSPRPSGGELDAQARALLYGSVVTDLYLRTALASVISAASLSGDPVRRLRREREYLEFYADLAGAHDASAVFRPPPEVEVSSRPGYGELPDGRIEILGFRSPYVALHPELRRSYARHRPNRSAHAQHWVHTDGPRPTLVVVHGFGASPAWFNSWFFSLPGFFAEGWDVLLFTLPFHGARRGTRLPVNGVELFMNGLSGLNEALIHGIHDLRVLLEYLRAGGSPRVGVTGLSLGGYVSGLLAAIDPDLDFVIPNAAVTWIPKLMPGWFPANITTGALRLVSGVPEALTEQALSIHSPLNYAPVVDHDRLMVVGGLGDRLAPPEQSLLLWEHWDRPRVHWFPGSHVLHFGRSGYLDEMRELMGTPSSPAAAS